MLSYPIVSYHVSLLTMKRERREKHFLIGYISLTQKYPGFLRAGGAFYETHAGQSYKVDMVSDFHISRAGMHRSVKYDMALSIQREIKNAKETKYSADDPDGHAPHDRFSVVGFCHSTGNRWGARRCHFLLPMFRSRIIK